MEIGLNICFSEKFRLLKLSDKMINPASAAFDETGEILKSNILFLSFVIL